MGIWKSLWERDTSYDHIPGIGRPPEDEHQRDRRRWRKGNVRALCGFGAAMVMLGAAMGDVRAILIALIMIGVVLGAHLAFDRPR
ncbi:hypothetical protein F4553_001601 [Allocatelliglobosispora scoriae]|uniref:DUF3040 domain-containing protein n=1 Tax=Allocatelliglobosispora scoriae TaxID=643052 RepID=A0A841BN97_9ACTN|nr:hypothetical protein [Allocatelliglobosispora scoriae]MBB5868222.1 hypothetical protein [Allocatelliglobosispora scoriae]